ncbi:ethylbenzene dehydrogenase, partial [Acidianus sp. RZ1]
MNGYAKLLVIGLVVFLVIVGIGYGLDQVLNAAEVSSSTVTAYYVPNAQLNEGDPGSEMFWQSIPWSTVPLVPTVPVPNGISGHTTTVYVKAAWTYVDGVPYIFILMKAPVVGYESWQACAERIPSGQIWQPFSNAGPVGWWDVNVSFSYSNQSVVNVTYLRPDQVIQYPPGQAMANPVQIIVLNQSGKLVGEVIGATLPNGNPLNNGQPVIIHSLSLNYNGTMITSLSQFLSMGLNDTTWSQSAYNEFYPEDTAGYVSLFYNSTYMYPERFAIMWLLGGVPKDWTQIAYTPHMMPGTSGALSAGEAEIWVLNNNPRANNTADFGYPGPTLFSRTTAPPYYHYPQYKDPLNLGYLKNQGIIADLYSNGSSIYYIGGPPYQGFPYINSKYISTWQFQQFEEGTNTTPINVTALWNPSVVATGFKFYNTPTGPWMKAVFARTFTTFGVSGGQGESHYQIQLKPGNSYWVAFAVFQGGSGESVDFKSISFWWRIYIQPPSGSTSALLPLFIIGNSIAAPAIAISLFVKGYSMENLRSFLIIPKNIIKVITR